MKDINQTITDRIKELTKEHDNMKLILPVEEFIFKAVTKELQDLLEILK